MTNKTLIVTPGPVSVPEFVWAAIAKPAIHQREKEFAVFFRDFQSRLQYFFQTKGAVLGLPGTGTLGVEIAMRSLFLSGDKILIPVNGRFSERWSIFGKSIGLNVVSLVSKNGEGIEKTQLKKMLDSHPDVKGIVFTHCETSTGATLDLEVLLSVAKEKTPQALRIVDTVSTAGILPFYMDAWFADVAIAASQKSLLNPAGTVFVALSARAETILNQQSNEDASTLFPYYKALSDFSYPYTPPCQLFFGVDAVLQKIQKDGLPHLWNENHRKAKRFRQEMVKLGGKLFPKNSGDSLTAFYFEGIDNEEIRLKLKEYYGIHAAGGQAELKGKILRIAHFGNPDENEDLDCILALKALLKK